MHWINITFENLRVPAEPYPTPVKEPEDSPENPEVPIREPDPDDPKDI